jgi:hypothetical protein
MNPQAAKPGAKLQRYILALADACPLDQSNPEHCPLHELRKLKMEERLEWLRELNKDDARYLAAYHHVCLTVRGGTPSVSRV